MKIFVHDILSQYYFFDFYFLNPSEAQVSNFNLSLTVPAFITHLENLSQTEDGQI